MKTVNKNSHHCVKIALPYAPFLAVKQPPAPVPAGVEDMYRIVLTQFNVIIKASMRAGDDLASSVRPR
jgi:hypothetical protein